MDTKIRLPSDYLSIKELKDILNSNYCKACIILSEKDYDGDIDYIGYITALEKCIDDDENYAGQAMMDIASYYRYEDKEKMHKYCMMAMAKGGFNVSSESFIDIKDHYICVTRYFNEYKEDDKINALEFFYWQKTHDDWVYIFLNLLEDKCNKEKFYDCVNCVQQDQEFFKGFKPHIKKLILEDF